MYLFACGVSTVALYFRPMFTQSRRLRLIMHELKTHLPYTLLGAISGILLLGLIYQIFIRAGHFNQHETFENFFHVFHFGHIFLSAIATTAIFFRHDRNILKTIAIGFFGTLVACGISDLFLPYLGGKLLGAEMHLHVCLFENPLLVLLINAAGIAVGMMAEIKIGKISYLSHSSHVFISSFASLFYLVTFGLQNWMHLIFGIFLVTTLAVIIPCCSSDIVIPLSFVTGFHGHEHEDEHTH